MTFSHKALTVALAVGSALVLAGCSSGEESAHDRAAHEAPAAPSADGHTGHDHGGAKAAPTDSAPSADSLALTEIEPSADYPLTTCVVSGDALDALDERSAFKYGDEEVQFCCEGCIDEFKADPEAFMKKVREAKSR